MNHIVEQLEFQSSGVAKTQLDRLEAHFKAYPNIELPGPQLAAVMTGGTGVGTTPIRRIHDLRHKRGMNIPPPRKEYRKQDGRVVCCTWFKYIP